MIGIYLIKEKNTNNLYIGQSNNIFRRINEHFTYVLNDEFHNKIRLNPNNFEVSIIEICSIEDLNLKENYWINYYKEKGYYLYNSIAAPSGTKKITKNNTPPNENQIQEKIEEIIGKPLFKKDKENLVNFFQIKGSNGKLKKWPTVKKFLIDKGLDIFETKRLIGNKRENCSIIKIRMR